VWSEMDFANLYSVALGDKFLNFGGCCNFLSIGGGVRDKSSIFGRVSTGAEFREYRLCSFSSGTTFKARGSEKLRFSACSCLFGFCFFYKFLSDIFLWSVFFWKSWVSKQFSVAD